MLTPEMMEALKVEIEIHDGCHDLPLCVYLMVIAACYNTDEEFTEELWEEARIFVVDEVMMSCILKGAVEVHGIDEDGELTFAVTEWGKDQCAQKKSTSSGANEQDSQEESG